MALHALQLTRPTGDETYTHKGKFTTSLHIATHTPHRGRKKGKVKAFWQRRLQLTRPTGDETNLAVHNLLLFLLQLTRPTGDETSAVKIHDTHLANCNSHAPQGTKLLRILFFSSSSYCNSHAPQGTKLNVKLVITVNHIHCNSHAPQGTKLSMISSISPQIYCNSHAPQGTKPVISRYCLKLSDCNSHAPQGTNYH